MNGEVVIVDDYRTENAKHTHIGKDAHDQRLVFHAKYSTK